MNPRPLNNIARDDSGPVERMQIASPPSLPLLATEPRFTSSGFSPQAHAYVGPRPAPYLPLPLDPQARTAGVTRSTSPPSRSPRKIDRGARATYPRVFPPPRTFLAVTDPNVRRPNPITGPILQALHGRDSMDSRTWRFSRPRFSRLNFVAGLSADALLRFHAALWCIYVHLWLEPTAVPWRWAAPRNVPWTRKPCKFCIVSFRAVFHERVGRFIPFQFLTIPASSSPFCHLHFMAAVAPCLSRA
jgi:hypothetical protein